MRRLFSAPLCLTAAVSMAAAQIGQPEPTPTLDPDAKERAKEPAVPVEVQLGQRVDALRRAATQLATVVIVSDEESYLAALGQWRPDRRFPVLIDDGSPESRESIARFVRGYKPEKVVRWSVAGDDKAAVGAAGFDKVDPVKYFAAVQAAWDVKTPSRDQSGLLEAWRASGHRPPGVVVASGGDRAWTAALALAIAWGQPTILIPSQPGSIDWSYTPSEADKLATGIENACEDFKYPWKGKGDDIEAVTLCLNCPERIAKSGNEFLALTDRIGRLGTGVEAKDRWAWAGHIFGSAAQAAYLAMCSIFLEPTSAWIFDGYPDTSPWNTCDGTQAGEIAKQTGMQVEVMDKPNGSAHAWRVRAARPVDAGLILVNTRGNADFFDLEPGQCKPGDVPILTVPAALHLIHSWSLLFPGKRDTLGGRWLERGVFAYAGSVHEPMLHTFQTTPNVAGRFCSGAPFGAAVRLTNAPLWKIAVLGDPLYVFGPSVKRLADAPPLEKPRQVGENLRELLSSEKYTEGVQALKLLGRDTDIAKLAGALLDTKPDKVDPALARECILPAFRAGNAALVVRLYGLLPLDSQADPVLRDALWLAAYPMLERPKDDALLLLLKANIRPDQIERDAKTLAAAWAANRGAASTGALFQDLRARFTEKPQRDALEKAAKSTAPWGK